MTNWIEHDGGPQPVGDDVWVIVEWANLEGRYTSKTSKEMGEAGEILPWEGHKLRYRILNDHLIDAARLEGIRLGLEAAEKYNRRAFDLIVDALRNTNPDTIAREAVLDQLTREAQADNMGYAKEADQ